MGNGALATRLGERQPGGLAAVDRMTLGFVGALAALAFLCHARPWPLVMGLVALALAIVATARWATRSAIGRVVHDFFPIAGMITIFSLAGPVIGAANPTRWDASFATLDVRLFGAFPAAWFGALGRPAWLVDAASVAYVSYYVVPVAMAVALYASGRRGDFDELVFVVVATFLVSYATYFLAPTSGPRVPASAEAAVLGGGAISAVVRAFLRIAEYNQLDAFPSGHTTVSLVCLVLGWRMLPRWRPALVLVVAAIVFSTVYLSLHYVVDLVGGVLLALAMPMLLPGLRRLSGFAELEASAG